MIKDLGYIILRYSFISLLYFINIDINVGWLVVDIVAILINDVEKLS